MAMAAGAVLSIAAVAGCATQPPALAAHTATVTINGHETQAHLRVSCTQFGWNWKIVTVPEAPGFTAMLEAGNTPSPKAVQIRDLGGFTGAYWKYTTGDADVRIDGSEFSLSGTAVGYTSEQPNKTSSATFAITTGC